MSGPPFLLDASAFWRLGSRHLASQRREEVANWVERGLVSACTPLLLETRSGRDLPSADPADLPQLWISERAERRATQLQDQLRSARRHLGVPPLDYLIAGIAEAHGVSVLHYDADFDRISTHTDLSVAVVALSPLGSIP